MANIIKLQKADRTAYNPDRPLEKNQLIQSQVTHFHIADLELPPELQTGIDIATVLTEGQAGDYIRQVTQAIHSSGGLKPAKEGAGG